MKKKRSQIIENWIQFWQKPDKNAKNWFKKITKSWWKIAENSVKIPNKKKTLKVQKKVGTKNWSKIQKKLDENLPKIWTEIAKKGFKKDENWLKKIMKNW